MTLSRAVGRIPRSVLYGALKVTSAEGKKEMVLEMEMFPLLSLCFLPFRKVHSQVPSKAAVLQHQAKSSYEGEVGARHLLLEEQFAVGRTKTQIRNQSVSPSNALVIYNSSKQSRSLRTRRKLVNPFAASCTGGEGVDLQWECSKCPAEVFHGSRRGWLSNVRANL